MAIYLKDLVENPGRLRELRAQQPRCAGCEVVLQETITGRRQSPKGEVCSDCYYGLLGDEIEKHPIASAGIRRG
jgi:hypothetical protein